MSQTPRTRPKIGRRTVLTAAAGVAGSMLARSATPATIRSPGGPISAFGLDGASLGLRPGSPDDQSAAFTRAIRQAADAGVPLALPPGVYRAGNVALPAGSHIVSPRGSSKIEFSGGAGVLSAEHVGAITLSGLVLDGGGKPLPDRRGLLNFEDVRGLRISDCVVVASGRHGICATQTAGDITGTTITRAADVAILSYDGRGLTIARNTISDVGNNGIQLLRFEAGDDATMVLDNRIERVRNVSGGTGQFGNAINAHRTGGVMVRGNVIRDCAYSGVRGNSASGIQIIGNSVRNVGEVALYSEFSFEGAVIANNTVDGAETGVSVANFNEGGRLCTVSGNIFRNLRTTLPNREPGALYGVGIYVEADTAVTGNVVDSATAAGVAIGWGRFLRDVAATGNVIRAAPIGVAVSVMPGTGSTLVANNVISQATRGAVVGMDHEKPITGDLTREGAARYAHLTLAANRVS